MQAQTREIARVIVGPRRRLLFRVRRAGAASSQRLRNSPITAAYLLKRSVTRLKIVLTECASRLRPVAIATPIHGPAFIAITRSVQLKVIATVVLLVFVALTASEINSVYGAFASELGTIETSILRAKTYRINEIVSFTLDIQVRKENGTLDRRNLDAARWSSSDEAILPDGDDIELLYATLSTVIGTLVNHEGRLVSQTFYSYAHMAVYNAKTYNDDSRVQAWAQQHDTLLSSDVYRFWRNTNSVNLADVFRTIAVLLCLRAEPEMTNRMGSADICTKANVVGVFQRSTYALGLEWVRFEFGLPVTHGARRGGHVSVSVSRLLRPKNVLYLFGFCFRVHMGSYVAKGCEFAWTSVRRTRISVRRTPIRFRRFARHGEPRCVEMNDTRVDSLETCTDECAAAHLRDVCGCDVLKNVYQLPRQAACETRNSSEFQNTTATSLTHCYDQLRSEPARPYACMRRCQATHCDRVQDAYASGARPFVHRVEEMFGGGMETDARSTIDVADAFGMSYHIEYGESPAWNAIDFVTIVGGVLGVWTGNSFIACFHVAAVGVVLIIAQTIACRQTGRNWLSKNGTPSARSSINVDTLPTTEGHSVYFHFFPSTFRLSSSAGVLLWGLTVAIFWSFCILETVDIMRAYSDEKTVTQMSIEENWHSLVDPAICFEIGVPNRRTTLDSSSCARNEVVHFRDEYYCLSALMQREQSVFFSTSKLSTQSVADEDLEKCARFIECRSTSRDPAGEELGDYLIRAICEKLDFVVILQDRVQYKPCLNSSSVSRWIGPYAPHRRDSVCFALPAQALDYAYILLGSLPASTFCNSTNCSESLYSNVYIVANRSETFLARPNQDLAISVLPLRRGYYYFALFGETESHSRASLRRRPCSDAPADSRFQCERRCRQEFLQRACNYSAPSYSGRLPTYLALREAFGDEARRCVKWLLMNVRKTVSEIEKCVRVCTLPRCTNNAPILPARFDAFGLYPLPDYYMRLGYHYGVVLSNANYSTLVTSEALLYPNAESLLSAIGGSMGFWMGGSIFAAVHVILIIVDHALSRRRRSRTPNAARDSREIQSTQATIVNQPECAHDQIVSQTASIEGETEVPNSITC